MVPERRSVVGEGGWCEVVDGGEESNVEVGVDVCGVWVVVGGESEGGSSACVVVPVALGSVVFDEIGTHF